MKTTLFAHYLNKYLTVYLPNNAGCSPATIDSYRYVFIHFLQFMSIRGIPADTIEIEDLTASCISDFLSWLQTERGNSTRTRNHRQSVLNSFIRFLMYELPEHLNEYQRILSLPVKIMQQKEITYLKTEGVKLLFDQVDITKTNGLRDYVILSLLYTTGVRVSELINIRVGDVSLTSPPTLLVHGKGQKARYVPLVSNIVILLQQYMTKYHLYGESVQSRWLFLNHMNEQFQRQGINYIIKKYSEEAREQNAYLVPKDFSPHKMRHTTAMELVDSGVDLIYVRDLLGHVSVRTTEVYAKTSTTKRREVIEAASIDLVPMETAEWEGNNNLLQWLKKFNRC